MSEQRLIPNAAFELPPKTVRTLKHRWSYYKAPHAEAVRKLLDKLHDSKEILRVPAKHMSIETLRLQYYQGAAYLIDNDESGKYEALYKRTRCRAFRGQHYIELSIKSDISDLEGSCDDTGWREKLLEFIELSVVGNRISLPFKFDEEDRTWIRSQLEPFADKFIWQIADNELIVIKDKE